MDHDNLNNNSVLRKRELWKGIRNQYIEIIIQLVTGIQQIQIRAGIRQLVVGDLFIAI